ncbi:MAG: sugar phosphate isomerase/epimerase [Candidatus Sumerlaeia bacterium]|nr:sugar phosphate isomerase/epimerase [Candidatus Sumerlaeia bacterium]
MTKKQKTPRRQFLREAVAASAALATAPLAHSADTGHGLHIATNQYPWTQFYRREGKDFLKALDAGLAEVASTGVNGYEPLMTGVQDVEQLAPLLQKHRLGMRSLYINSVLHKSDEAEKSIGAVLAIAEKARAIGTTIIVVNPTPIRWGGPENKNDAELVAQANALNTLGARLRAIGLTLAYHNHDIELRHAAREFHHMMLGTDPTNVSLCLDAHWIYRGAGNSSVALFDVLKLYGRRVSELHLRQSRNGVWTEAFGEGDIDYPALAAQLLQLGVKPHLVLEQAVEKESPNTMGAVEAHRRGVEYARKVFAAFAS